jgi:Transglycosylase SLT domain.
MRRKGFASVSIIALITVIVLDTLVLLSIPPNPSDSVLRAKFIEVAKKYNIPSVILMGIAYTESGWKQFDATGAPIIHTNTDGSIDIGIMQINSTGRSDLDRLKTDVFYNIEVGAKILDGKWKITPAIGDSDRNILENWYYAIWAYNGFSYTNHPLNPQGRHYQDKVIDNIGKLIIGDDGQPLWTPVKITKPDPTKITNPPSYIDTPTPYHFGDLYENPNR